MNKIYYIDIDNTICTQEADGDYKNARPWMDRIEKVNKLYDEGNKIIFYTARGTKTHINWFKITKNQLKKWNVKYHELKMSKPQFDYFIDDKAINSNDFFINKKH